MRDPGRIDRVLEAARRVWVEHPDLRLGQLLYNAVGPAEPCSAIYAVEDTAPVRKLATLAKRLRTRDANGSQGE